jgi:hypothetical protein
MNYSAVGKTYIGDYIKDFVMGETCSTYGGKVAQAWFTSLWKLSGRDNMKELGVGGKDGVEMRLGQ